MQKYLKLLSLPLRQQIVKRNTCDVTKIGYLHNGMRIASQCTNTFLTSIAFSIEGGTRLEREHNNGINNYLSHIAMKGSFSMPCPYIDNMLYLHGGKCDVKVRRERLVFVVTCLPSLLCHVIEMFSTIAQKTDPNWVEHTKPAIFQQLDELDKNPKKVLFDYLHASAFQGCSLGYSPYGTSDSNYNLTCSDVEDFIKNYFDPMRFIIGVAGNVNHQVVLESVDRFFAHIPGRATCEDVYQLKAPVRFTGSMVAYRNDDMPKCHVAIAFPTPGLCHFETCLQLNVLKEMVGSYHKSQLGGLSHPTYVGQASAIEHYCDFYESFFFPYSDIGLFGIYFVSSSVDIDDMVLAIQHYWRELIIAPSKVDVVRATNQVKLKLGRKYAGTHYNCLDIVEQIALFPARAPLCKYVELLKKVTPKTISNLCYRMIYDKCPVVAGVGPTEGIPNYTRVRAGQWSYLY